MSENVKPRRRYDGTQRQQQSRRTRWAILQAAQQLFLDLGFSATTMPLVAERAGVSVQTVYKYFANKAGLVKAVFDIAMAGDDDPRPMIEREKLSAVRAEPDPRRQFVLYGEFLAQVAPRHVPIQLLIRDAAAGDADAAAAWEKLQEERLRGMTRFAKDLHRAGHLAPGISSREARDVLWIYNSAELFQLLVLQRGWSPGRYGAWVGRQLTAALLPQLGSE
jgi:AcrR family transcriptional regulator